jgi:hypothetical protein
MMPSYTSGAGDGEGRPTQDDLNQREQEESPEAREAWEKAEKLREKQEAATEAGEIPQIASAELENYPDAAYKVEKARDEPTSEQPLTGTAATAEEHPK